MKRMRNVFFKTGICLLALVVMVGIALPCRAADLSTVETVLAQTITRYLCDWTVKGYSSAYKDISAAADIWSLSTEDSAVTAEALVTVTMTLKDKSVSTMPAIQGMLSALGMTQYNPSVNLAAQLPAAGKGQTEQQLTQAEAQLKSWYTELSGYINTPFTGNLDLTLKGKLTSDGRLDESSVQLLIADGNDLVPAENVLPRSDSQCKADGISIMQEALADNSASIPTIQASFTYDRMAAKEYADQWTSNAPGPSYYDTAKWHLQKYPGSVAYTGGDCVDYVSQALVAGGLPQDSSWTAYTPAWLSLSKFLPYMTGKGYLIKSNFTAAAAGAVRIFVEVDSQGRRINSHIVMITKNDTRTRWYSGHTHDQRQQPYSDDANKLYYIVRGTQ